MSGKIFVWLLATVLLSTAPRLEAQQPTKDSADCFPRHSLGFCVADRVDAFRKGLRELGYLEGENILVEYRFGRGKIGSK